MWSHVCGLQSVRDINVNVKLEVSMNAPFGMPPSKSISSSKIDIFARERLILERTKSSLYQGLCRQDYVKQNEV